VRAIRNKPPAGDSSSAEAARERALRLLTVRPRGREELARALVSRGFDRAAVSRALTRLTDEGWLDGLRGERYGARRIERELRSRGFSRETIDTALSERDPELEERTLRRALEKVWSRCAGLPAPARRRRALEALARRGFPLEKVSEMIEHLSHDEVQRGPRALS
jgi:SOS response regulatory protein OraA/RecX